MDVIFGCNLQAIILSLFNHELFLPRLLQEALQFCILNNRTLLTYMICSMDYRRPVTKSSLLHSWKSTPTPKFLGKVRIFWEGHKIWKNLPLKIWRYSVTTNFKWKIFSNFVAFSEYPNFTSYSKYVLSYQSNHEDTSASLSSKQKS